MPDDWNNGLESEPVTTYVSPETKEVWVDHADELGMSLSRFVESMVKVGRAEYADTAPEGHEDDIVGLRRETEALRQEIETLEGRVEGENAVEVYAELGDTAENGDDGYVTVETLADRVEADEPAVYESLQTLLEEGLIEYDTMRNAYRRTE